MENRDQHLKLGFLFLYALLIQPLDRRTLYSMSQALNDFLNRCIECFHQLAEGRLNHWLLDLILHELLFEAILRVFA